MKTGEETLRKGEEPEGPMVGDGFGNSSKKSHGSHQTGETINFVILKMMLWLLCGQWIGEGWGGDMSDQLSLMQPVGQKTVMVGTVETGDIERNGEILNIFLFKS